ncbi:glutaredoxin [Vallitalea maricola]|uniref:Glutaredoxin n=1 Tax=Vallitalea maricola TaxID=3074433 RepID=A0ACB5UMS2_9FIRM|nr:glutaredoxin [Vallitalea sp. AN17-2]
MKAKVIGSHLCPDTLWAINQLAEANIETDFKDILSCHADLKQYLKLRETSEAYAEIHGTDRLGLPCFICEDGTITFDIKIVLNKKSN